MRIQGGEKMKKNILKTSLALLLAGGAAMSLGACTKDQATTQTPTSTVTTTQKPTTTVTTQAPTTTLAPTQTTTTTTTPVNDNIDWAKLETVAPGYGNIGDYKQIQLDITSEESELKIGGFLNVPADFDTSKQYPLVIMSHGIAGSVTTYDQNYVAYMLEKGVICYTYFFCGGGSPTTSPSNGVATKMHTISEGDSKDMSIITEKKDLISVFNALSEKSFVDKDKIVLMGESMGGAVTSLAAVELQDKIAGEILCYPAMTVYQDAIDSYMRYDKIPEDLARNGLTLHRETFYKDIKDIDFYKEAAKFTKKVCLLHGDKDGTVNISSSEKLNSMLKDSMYQVVPGGGHGFTNATLQVAIPHIMSYLKAINVISDDTITVGATSGTFVTNHPQEEPTQLPAVQSPLKRDENAVELARYTSSTKHPSPTPPLADYYPELIFYSDGTVGTTGPIPPAQKLGEWRYIDGKITIGIEGNGIKYSTMNDDYTKLILDLGWLGGQFHFEIDEAEFIEKCAGNHGKVDRLDWVGMY